MTKASRDKLKKENPEAYRSYMQRQQMLKRQRRVEIKQQDPQVYKLLLDSERRKRNEIRADPERRARMLKTKREWEYRQVGITPQEFKQHVEELGNMCCFCPAPIKYVEPISAECKKTSGMALLEHDHKTNKFRAPVCCRCNTFIGAVENLIAEGKLDFDSMKGETKDYLVDPAGYMSLVKAKRRLAAPQPLLDLPIPSFTPLNMGQIDLVGQIGTLVTAKHIDCAPSGIFQPSL